MSRQRRSAITSKVGREPLKFPGRGRQTSEDEGEASQERARIGIDGGCEPLRLHFREEKTVHRMRRPRAVRDCGRHVIFHGLERPPHFPRGEQLAPVGFRRGFRSGIVARIWRTQGNPTFKIGDDGGGEFRRFVRHFEIGIGVVDRGEERTLRRIAGYDDHTGVPALLPARPRIEPQAGLLFLRAVAIVAFGDEHRTDLPLEKIAPFGGEVRAGERRPQEGQRETEEGGSDCLHSGDGQKVGLKRKNGESVNPSKQRCG